MLLRLSLVTYSLHYYHLPLFCKAIFTLHKGQVAAQKMFKNVTIASPSISSNNFRAATKYRFPSIWYIIKQRTWNSFTTTIKIVPSEPSRVAVFLGKVPVRMTTSLADLVLAIWDNVCYCSIAHRPLHLASRI